MVGVLVQANHGQRLRLRVNGVPVGERIGPDVVPLPGTPEGAGSIIVLIATDAPLLPAAVRAPRTPRRLRDRAHAAAWASTRAATSRSVSRPETARSRPTRARSALRMLNDGRIDPLYEAVIDAVEESILNAMLAAETMTGRSGNTVHALPPDAPARGALDRPSSTGALPRCRGRRARRSGRRRRSARRACRPRRRCRGRARRSGRRRGRWTDGARSRSSSCPSASRSSASCTAPLGLGVERGGGLVEDEDGRVAQDRPRDRDPLALAAREAVAALADDRVVTLGKIRDQLVDLRGACGLLDLLVGRVRMGEAEVVANGGVEEVRLLGDDPDRIRERVRT